MLFFTDMLKNKKGCASGGWIVCVSAGKNVKGWSI